jgi:hypothetical protein
MFSSAKAVPQERSSARANTGDLLMKFNMLLPFTSP